MMLGDLGVVNFVLRLPEQVAAVCLINSFYGNAPSQRLPEFIDFATPSLRALSHAMLTNPGQMTFLLNFQRKQFPASLPDRQAQLCFKNAALTTLSPAMGADRCHGRCCRCAIADQDFELAGHFPEARHVTLTRHRLSISIQHALSQKAGNYSENLLHPTHRKLWVRLRGLTQQNCR